MLFSISLLIRRILPVATTLLVFALVQTVAAGYFPAAAQGMLTEEPAQYAAFRSAPVFRSYLPKSIDLSADFPSPGNQGNQGSCTGWAVGYGLRSYYERKGLVDDDFPKDLGFSPAFLYNQVKNTTKGCDSGALISGTLNFMQEFGVAPMPNFPYSVNDCTKTPSEKAQAIANNFKIKSWQRVDFRTTDDIKGELFDGHPVLIGMWVTEDFQRLRDGSTFVGSASKETGFGHAMVAVGYDDNRRAFKMMNSWSTQWGDGGFGWIDYDSFLENTMAAFSVRVRKSFLTLASFVSSDTSKPKLTPIPKPEIKIKTDYRKNIKQAMTTPGCGVLSLSDGQAGGVKISGYLGSKEEIGEIRKKVSAARGDIPVEFNIALRPWPQCEALQTFDNPLDKPQGLSVSIRGAQETGMPTLTETSFLEVSVTTPNFPSYLYVTYLQSGGDAVHLIRPSASDEPLPPNQLMTFGQDPKRERFMIAEPFGVEMIVAIATRKPLFDKRNIIVEHERKYLSQFRQAILQQLGTKIEGRVAAAYTQLKTRQK